MRDIIIEEMEQSAGIILGGSKVVPRFRNAVLGEADHVVLMPLPNVLDERRRRL